MTVAELRELLKVMPADAPVVVQLGMSELGNDKELRNVQAVTAQVNEFGRWIDTEWCTGDTEDGWSTPQTVVNLTS